MAERLLLADFEPLVGDSFRLAADVATTSFDVVLVGAEKLASRPEPDVPAVSFSLLFRGPPEPKLPQMIRHLEHPDLGVVDIFLVPVHEDERGRSYEAIFNYED